MKYLKASDVLPPHLLEEIHKYIDGCIKTDFMAGTAICELSEKYGLSVETIRKIVYSH